MSKPTTNLRESTASNWPLKKRGRKLKRPPLYRVVLINDDYTPMEFVVDILETVFAMERTRATQVMLEVHTKGKGICGVFSFEIAETKVAQVMAHRATASTSVVVTMEES